MLKNKFYSIKKIFENSDNRQWVKTYFQHIKYRSSPPKPSTLILLLNKKCNLKCSFCNLKNTNKGIPLQKVTSILNSAKNLGIKTIVLTGGEPFLHPKLFEIIRFAKKKGFGTNVTTNGILIKEHIQKILDSELDSISVSLDGSKKIHDSLRGVKGSYDKLLEGLNELKKYRKRIKVSIYFVVTRRNVQDLIQVYNLTKKLGFEFNFWPVNNVPSLNLKKPAEVKAYKDSLKFLKKEGYPIQKNKKYFLKAIDYHKKGNLNARCLGLSRQLGIDTEGNLYPCCFWQDSSLRVGNVFEEKLEDLWGSDKALKMRRKIFTKGCNNGCYNHSLAEFTQITKLPFILK